MNCGVRLPQLRGAAYESNDDAAAATSSRRPSRTKKRSSENELREHPASAGGSATRGPARVNATGRPFAPAFFLHAESPSHEEPAMNVFETLFPPRSRGPARRSQNQPGSRGRRNRLRGFGFAEQLERRDLLAAATLQQTSPNEFFIDLKNSGTRPHVDSEYVTYRLTNGDTAYTDVWVELSGTEGDVVHRATHETGYYRIGPLAANAAATAYFYFTTSSDGGPVTDSHTIKAYEGDPREGSLTPFAVGTGGFVNVEEVLDANSTKIDSVTVSPAMPVLGGTMTMTVGGELGQAERALFTPATNDLWRPDVFVLESTTIGGVVPATRKV